MHKATSFVLSFLVAASLHAESTPSSVTLTSSTNPAVYGRSATFTATLTPSSATGKVTFYSGTAILRPNRL